MRRLRPALVAAALVAVTGVGQDLPDEREAPPPCPGTPVSVSAAKGPFGAEPFTSEESIAQATGSTIYIIHDLELGPATPKGKRRRFLHGEPLILCRSKPLRNPGQVLSEEVFSAGNVLAKDRAGRLYDPPLSAISRTPPRFSLATPDADAATTLGAAFEEAVAMKEHGVGGGPVSSVTPDRSNPKFWEFVAAKVRDADYSTAKRLVLRVVRGTKNGNRGWESRLRSGVGKSCSSTDDDCGEDGARWYESATDPVLLSWYFEGIDDGGQRKAYQVFAECLDGGTKCDEAKKVAASPPKATGEATVGGTLVVHVKPERLASKATLEIDGEAVPIAKNGDAKKIFAADGTHTLKVSAPKLGNSHSVTVVGGKTEDVTLPLLPGH